MIQKMLHYPIPIGLGQAPTKDNKESLSEKVWVFIKNWAQSKNWDQVQIKK